MGLLVCLPSWACRCHDTLSGINFFPSKNSWWGIALLGRYFWHCGGDVWTTCQLQTKRQYYDDGGKFFDLQDLSDSVYVVPGYQFCSGASFHCWCSIPWYFLLCMYFMPFIFMAFLDLSLFLNYFLLLLNASSLSYCCYCSDCPAIPGLRNGVGPERSDIYSCWEPLPPWYQGLPHRL